MITFEHYRIPYPKTPSSIALKKEQPLIQTLQPELPTHFPPAHSHFSTPMAKYLSQPLSQSRQSRPWPMYQFQYCPSLSQYRFLPPLQLLQYSRPH
jgi:hypothetical protein